MMSLLRNAYVIGLCLVIELANCGGSFAQSAQTTASPSNNQELNGKIEMLTRSLEQTQTELARSRSEIEQLRTMLGEVLKRMDGGATVTPPQGANAATGEAAAPAAQISQHDWDLLNPRVEEQRQTIEQSG